VEIPWERYLDGTLEKKVLFGGESVMVWGGIILNGRKELVVIRERSMTTRRYINDVFEAHVIQFAENNYESRTHYVAG
jgi:hypothetical protein